MSKEETGEKPSHYITVSDASRMVGIPILMIHKLINHYHYISPPRTGEYNKQPTFLLSENDVTDLEIYAHLEKQGFKPREITYIRVIFSSVYMSAIHDLEQLITTCGCVSVEVLERQKSNLRSMLDERMLQALDYVTSKLPSR